MTIREHLEAVRAQLLSSGAQEQEALFFQLYLLCLAAAGVRAGGRVDPRTAEPFSRLEPLVGRIPGTDAGGEESAVRLFLEEAGSDYADAEIFREEAGALMTLSARRGVSFDHFQPREITELASVLSGYSAGQTVYNPYAGVGSYADAFKAGDSYYGEEYDPLTWGIGVLRMWMDGVPSRNYIQGDSLNPCWDRQFDLIVSTPPVGWIEQHRETYCSRLVADAASRLAPGGTAVIVTAPGSLMGPSGEAIARSGLLDMVVALPVKVFYWTPIAPVLIRLKAGRGADEPVLFVDGKEFFTVGGSNLSVLDVRALLGAVAAGAHCASLTPRELEENDWRLTPALYVGREEDPVPTGGRNCAGQRTVQLRDLGKFLTLSVAETPPAKGIRIQDLVKDPREMEIEPVELDGDTSRYRRLDRPALLLHATVRGVRMASVRASERKPVFIAPGIQAFVADPEKADPEYVAMKLASAGLAIPGSSKLVLSRDDLMMTAIPALPLQEQREQAQRYFYPQLSPSAESSRPGGREADQPLLYISSEDASLDISDVPEVALKDGAPARSETRSRRKIGISYVGNDKDLSGMGSILKKFRIARQYPNAWKAQEAVSEINGQEALVICQGASEKSYHIASLVHAVSVPAYIVSQKPIELEEAFEEQPEKFVGHVFMPGEERDFYEALRKELEYNQTPEARLRKTYETQLRAADNIDAFRPGGHSLRQELEEMLLADLGEKDIRSGLRSIRDDCFLGILIENNQIPAAKKDLSAGALTSLVADRYYRPWKSRYMYVLKQGLIPEDLGVLLKAGNEILNEGAHTRGSTLADVQRAALHTVMGCLVCLSELIDSGKLENTSGNGNWTRVDLDDKKSRVEGAILQVKSYKRYDNRGYYYAGNVHLNDSRCERIGVREGSRVWIKSVVDEKSPLVDDSRGVWFYSDDFDAADE